MAIESIAKTLGTGSGIDIKSLVDQLVEAQYADKNQAITAKTETLSAQISAASAIKSGISAFDSALKTLIQSGSLATQPTSSNSNIVKVSALPGATVSGLTGTLEVRQLASAQVTASASILDKTAPIGTGTLTLKFGTAEMTGGTMTGFTAGSAAPIDIVIGADSSLTGIASAINAQKTGITASVLTDSTGSRLVIKSATGAAQAFTLDASAGDAALQQFNIGVGSPVSAAAQDAIVAVDGVAVTRASNSISDLITGVKIELVSASVGSKVSLGTQAPTAALSQAVGDVVDTYNQLYAQLKAATDPITGKLKADPAAKSLLRAMSRLTTQSLITGAGASDVDTLAEIGVGTNRDGTLKLNASQLSAALLGSSDKVEKMFKSAVGLSGALSMITIEATGTKVGLGASEARYTKAQGVLADEKTKAASAAENMRTRMTRQFAGMDSAVSRYKSTQSFLSQQVDAWNSNS